jgi:membrane protease YdiL (CAAX protease family)
MTNAPDDFIPPADHSRPPIPPPLPPSAVLPPASPAPYTFGHPAPPPPPAKPTLLRIWPAIVSPLVAVFVATIASTVAIVAFAMVDGGPELLRDQAKLMAWVAEFGGTPPGFLMLVLPGQLTFVAAALLGAWLSPEPAARRLNLERPTTPWWAVVLLLPPATVFAGALGDLLTSVLFGDVESEHLEMLYDLFRGPSGAFLVLVVLAISVLPGFSEELLFRGYCQSRLLKRIPPAAALAISSVGFSAAHLDPMHVVGVLPIGIWLGVVAWLSRSIWPAIICHAANNALAVLATNLGLVEPDERIQFDAAGLTLLGVSGAFAALSVWVMWKYRGNPPRPPVLELSPGGPAECSPTRERGDHKVPHEEAP